MTTLKAKKACAEWLRYCLQVGWPKSALDGLEDIWWRFHNEAGELVSERTDG